MVKPSLSASVYLANADNSNTQMISINSEVNNLDGNLFRVALPFTTIETGTFSLSFLPKMRTVLLTGIMRGGDSDKKSFVEEIEAIINNTTQGTQTYINKINKSYTVKLSSFVYTLDKDNPNIMNWTLEMLNQN